MLPRIEMLPEKKLVGIHLNMSLANNRTAELWRSFMPKCALITNRTDAHSISMQVYPATYSFSNFDPTAAFDKWAAVAVTNFDEVPEGMDAFSIPPGLYAVFMYKGNPVQAAGFFQYLFGTWLPASEYDLDKRPHFEVLGDKYKNNDPSSEEEVWIPITPKPIM